MTFAEYLLVLQRRWRVWGAGLAAGLLAALVVIVVSPTRYTATALSFVTVAERVDSSGQSEIFQGSQFAVQRVKSYAPLVKSPEVLEPVISRFGLDSTVRQLGGQVSVSSAPETVLLEVSVSDADPALAARLADAISVRLGEVIEELETPRDSAVSNVKVSLARPAAEPTAPSSPRVLVDLVLGAAAGLALGLAAAVLRHGLDRRIKSSHDVRELTGMSPLGSTLHDRSARRHPLVALDWRSASAERYRTVRTALKFAAVDHGVRNFVVTSGVAEEGKTTVSCNLAIAWAQSGVSVCLVEADLRRPSVSSFLGIDGGVGLSDVLVGERVLDEVVVPWNQGMLSVLPAGSLPPDPAALLGSAAMASLVAELRARFEVVIYDSPPMLSVADAVVLGRLVDGVVLVIRSGATRRDHVTACLETLRRSRLALLGTVVAGERRRRSSEVRSYTARLDGDRVELTPRPARPETAAETAPVAAGPDRGAVTDLRAALGGRRPGGGRHQGSSLRLRPRAGWGRDHYFVEVAVDAAGLVSLVLGLQVDGVDGRLWEGVLDGVVAAGEEVQVRVRADGTSSTHLRAKVWRTGEVEPESWTAEVTDGTPALERRPVSAEETAGSDPDLGVVAGPAPATTPPSLSVSGLR
ncbi:polysaccharide biosynthesis tyrosine autokinase [Nocardioides sp.]|uniref:polysaccharide biosynthesis tyrosine autokinase n=1 Tax=Nocardioides sp. TaxID=35761 RepID=UPI0025EC7507|nr:polysaccharide biosynthesis tyrosine autokinase [Nocardioides sp.]